jgi:predicted nuclease of predicted toxin-antitoxin system
MNGFFFDENLPAKILFTPSLPIIHVSVLGRSARDTEIWQYAKDKNWLLLRKIQTFPSD